MSRNFTPENSTHLYNLNPLTSLHRVKYYIMFGYIHIIVYICARRFRLRDTPRKLIAIAENESATSAIRQIFLTVYKFDDVPLTD